MILKCSIKFRCLLSMLQNLILPKYSNANMASKGRCLIFQYLFMYVTCLLNRDLYVLSIQYIPNGDTFWLSLYLFMCQSFDSYHTPIRLRLWLCSSSAQHQQKEVMFPLSAIFSIIRLLRSTMKNMKNNDDKVIGFCNYFALRHIIID